MIQRISWEKVMKICPSSSSKKGVVVAMFTLKPSVNMAFWGLLETIPAGVWVCVVVWDQLRNWLTVLGRGSKFCPSRVTETTASFPWVQIGPLRRGNQADAFQWCISLNKTFWGDKGPQHKSVWDSSLMNQKLSVKTQSRETKTTLAPCVFQL